MDARRYVILHHREQTGDHWDIMLEHGDALATWKLDADPLGARALPVQGTRIEDHRKAYLEYTGAVSGDRGHVERKDSGACRILRAEDDEWAFTLAEGRLAGSFRLRQSKQHPAVWTLSRL
jgi:hypothetical protein